MLFSYSLNHTYDDTTHSKSSMNTTIHVVQLLTLIIRIIIINSNRNGADASQLERCLKEFKLFVALCTQRKSMLNKLRQRGKLTGRLREKINQAKDLSTLNDIWMPFREKRCTRADEARKRGLEPISQTIFRKQWSSVNTSKLKTNSKGIRDLLAEMFSECGDVRRVLRDFVNRHGAFHTTLKKKKKKDESKTRKNNKTGVYDMYKDWICSFRSIKGHHLMALERGAREKCLNVTVKIDAPCVRHAKTAKQGMENLSRMIVRVVFLTLFPFMLQLFSLYEKYHSCPHSNITNKQVRMMRDAAGNNRGKHMKPAHGVIDRALHVAAEDAWKRLIRPSLVREVRKKMRERAHDEAIECFASNVESLLMQPPRRGFRVLGVDPGFRMGCKLAVCDEQGVLLDSGVLYLHRRDQAVKILLEMTSKHRVNMIALGNGKASREVEKLIGSLKDKLRVPYVVVSEAGASVYVSFSLSHQK